MKDLAIDKLSLKRIAYIIGGIALNYILAYLIHKAGLPLYLDTIGTYVVSFVCGAFPGIVVAVATNTICCTFYELSIYYSILNIAVALCSAHFAAHNGFKSLRKIVMLWVITAVINGGLGSLLQWVFLGVPQFGTVTETADLLTASTNLPLFLIFVFLNTILNLVDKGLSVGIALVIVRFVPEAERLAIFNSGWKQTPMSLEKIKLIRKKSGTTKKSIQMRVTLSLLCACLALILIMGYVGIYLYFSGQRDSSTQSAWNAAQFAADVIDTDKLDEYVAKGRNAFGYRETEEMLYKIRKNAWNVTYLYVVRILDNRCQFIFDVAYDEENDESIDEAKTFIPGEMTDIEESFVPYIEDLHAGKKVGPIQSSGIWNDLITVYYPINDANGNCLCYVGADVSLNYMENYSLKFLFRVFLVMSGFLVLIFSYSVWKSSVYITYPINSMTAFANGFIGEIHRGGDIESLNRAVGNLKKMNIHTDDEIENLYKALCVLTGDMTELLWEIRHYSDAVSKMQNGLIVTMADMVENRDSDTGAHVQKTAEYVRIILYGLKDKGYYEEKLSPKYISDVIMSAPLHDVGKIYIPDKILNKPGKLTPEEYEIMKDHSMYGRMILEKAISTISGENYLKEARNMAAYHHEKWNGTGYPDGLHGEVIPLSARVMAVADVFDALTSKRVYKPPMPLDEVLTIIKEGSGKDFDPKCVEVFFDSLEDVKKVLRKYREYEGEI